MKWGNTKPHTAPRLAPLAISALILLAAPALAMQPANTKAGYRVGVEGGFGLTNGNKWAVAGDLDWGVRTGWMGYPYTAVVVDALNVGRSQNLPGVGGVTVDGRATLTTIGLRQPFNLSQSIPVAVEGGVSYLSANASGAGISKSANTAGGFLGVRGTWIQSGSTSLTGMLRYHFLSGGIWQAGVGLTGPIGARSNLSYQADYYHTGGAQISGISSQTDTILVGVRWSGGP